MIRKWGTLSYQEISHPTVVDIRLPVWAMRGINSSPCLGMWSLLVFWISYPSLSVAHGSGNIMRKVSNNALLWITFERTFSRRSRYLVASIITREDDRGGVKF